MTVWRHHGGYKFEELSLADVHTIIDALEYHWEACKGVEELKSEVQDIESVFIDMGHCGISEVVERLPLLD